MVGPPYQDIGLAARVLYLTWLHSERYKRSVSSVCLSVRQLVGLFLIYTLYLLMQLTCDLDDLHVYGHNRRLHGIEI